MDSAKHFKQIKEEVSRIDESCTVRLFVGSIDALENEQAMNPQSVSASPYLQMLDSEFQFEDFVTSGENQLAKAICCNISDNPGKEFNPAYLYGWSGTGKTHLLNATANTILKNNPHFKLILITAQEFAQKFAQAASKGEFQRFRDEFLGLDALLIDDVQFFSRGEATQDEFFLIFNQLFSKNKQIFITCDTPPSDVKKLKERLKSRFENGSVMQVGVPSFEARVTIIKHKVAKKGMKIADDAAEKLARVAKKDIRVLLGTLLDCIFLAEFSNKEMIDAGICDEAIKRRNLTEQRLQTINSIQSVVADHFSIQVSQLTSKTRAKRILEPRQIAMLICKELTQESLQSIGAAFGGRDHATVINSCHKIRPLIATGGRLERDYKEIMHVLQ